jgi:hypothetical protein
VNGEPDGAERGRVLLRIAWEVVSDATGRPLPPDPAVRAHAFLSSLGAVFVSLHRLQEDGRLELRGCLGSLEPIRPLIEDLRSNAAAAARRDPRFPTVKSDELDDLELEVTEVGSMRSLLVRSRSELLERLHPGVDGLFVRCGARRATFLPQVWERGRVAPDEFLSALLTKAGLPPDFWSPDLELFTYGTRSWSSRWPGRQPPGRRSAAGDRSWRR